MMGDDDRPEIRHLAPHRCPHAYSHSTHRCVHCKGVDPDWGLLVAPGNPDTVTLPRADYARLMHLAYAGAQYLSIPNGQTDVEPFEATEAWLDQIDKEAGNG